MRQKEHIEKGLGFGITTGIMTTLGMIVGLSSATKSLGAVIGGILAIAIADAFSDALGIHISDESKKGDHHVWTSAITAFIAKFLLSLTFIIPFLFLKLRHAVGASVVWGLLILTIYNYRLAKKTNKQPLKLITEHVLIAIAIIIITHYVGFLVEILS